MTTMLLMFVLAAGKDEPARWDFKDAPLGKLPAGWTEAQTGKGKGSVWKIAEAKDAPGGAGKALAQTAEGPGPLFNLCVADTSSFADLDLSVAFKCVAGDIDQGGGPLWRYQDADNYYVARMNPIEKNFRLYKVVAGKRTQIGPSAKASVDEGKWHTIRIVHKGNNIQCHLNGKLVVEASDDSIARAGKIGLWTKADAQTMFADLQARKE